MKKRYRFIAAALLLCFSIVLCLGIFGAGVAPGSGTRDDPYYFSSSSSLTCTEISFPCYVKTIRSFTLNNLDSGSVCFEEGHLYYLYIPVDIVGLSLSLVNHTSGSSQNLVSQTPVLAYDSENWNVYEFTATTDAIGYRVGWSSADSAFVYYFDDDFHEPTNIAGLVSQLLGTFLNVGNSFVTFIMSNWICLVIVTVIVTIAGLGIIRRLVKGV